MAQISAVLKHSSLSCTDGHCDSGQCGFGFYSVVLSKMSRSDAERYRRLVHQDLFVFDVGMIGRTACKYHEVMIGGWYPKPY